MTVFLKSIQANTFKSLFEVLQSILNDVNIYFRPDCIQILTLDIARVSLINVKIDPGELEEYECDECTVAGVNMADMYKLLKSISNQDVITMSIKEVDKMDILIENSVKKSQTKYTLKLLDIDDDLLEVPKLEMDKTTIIPSIDFQRICRDMHNLSKNITICRRDNYLIISCVGDFADQETQIECEEVVDAECISTFKLQYINLFTKSTSMCASLQILQDKNESPIIFKYNISNLGKIEFYLAPNIET